MEKMLVFWVFLYFAVSKNGEAFSLRFVWTKDNVISKEMLDKHILGYAHVEEVCDLHICDQPFF